MRARFISLHLDAVGFFASILCALHCALLPLLLLLMPMAPLEVLHKPFAELLVVGVSFLIAAVSLGFSFPKHRRNHVPLIMLLGFLTILAAHFTATSEIMELVLTSSGGVLVALGHYANWRYSHQHS